MLRWIKKARFGGARQLSALRPAMVEARLTVCGASSGMNPSQRRPKSAFRPFPGLAAAVLASIAGVAPPGAEAAETAADDVQAYVADTLCRDCHQAEYDDWLKHGKDTSYLIKTYWQE